MSAESIRRSSKLKKYGERDDQVQGSKSALVARRNESCSARRGLSATRRGESELQFGRCRGAAVDSGEPPAPCDHSGSQAAIGCGVGGDERTGTAEPYAHVGQDAVRRLHYDEGGWPPQDTERFGQEDHRRDRSLLGS